MNEETNVVVNIKTPPASLSGAFKIQAKDSNGNVRTLADWFSNIVTDAGLDRMGEGAFLTYCFVGSGSTPPTASDTSLASVATYNSAILRGAGPTSVTRVWDDDEGCGVYSGTYTFSPFDEDNDEADPITVSEVGIGWVTTGTPLFSRALVVNAEGETATVSWLHDETLIVTYSVRVYPWAWESDEDDYTGTVDISGTTHAVRMRPHNVENANAWNLYNGAQKPFSNISSSYWLTYAYDPDLVADPLGAPNEAVPAPDSASGVNSHSMNGTYASGLTNAYTPNSHKMTGTLTIKSGASNYMDKLAPTDCLGIAVIVANTTVGSYKVSYTPPILKMVNWTLTLICETPVWGRRA